MQPAPGSGDEDRRFAELQRQLAAQFRDVFPARTAPRTVVVDPSLSLDAEILAKIAGAQHYEERMLCMLMLLRLPNTRVVYVTSEPVAPSTVDYYLSLLSGIPAEHARRRLTMLACHDASPSTITDKVLARPGCPTAS